MTQTMYYANTTGTPSITEANIEKKTGSYVWIKWSVSKVHRVARLGDYFGYFDTWELAHEFLLKDAETYVSEAVRRLDQANNSLDKVKGMEKPGGV